MKIEQGLPAKYQLKGESRKCLTCGGYLNIASFSDRSFLSECLALSAEKSHRKRDENQCMTDDYRREL